VDDESIEDSDLMVVDELAESAAAVAKIAAKLALTQCAAQDCLAHVARNGKWCAECVPGSIFDHVDGDIPDVGSEDDADDADGGGNVSGTQQISRFFDLFTPLGAAAD
jgi:hypothetical protein